MHLIIALLLAIIAILSYRIVSYRKELRNLVPSKGISVKNCRKGIYVVLGQITIPDEELAIPSGLSRHYTLVHYLGDEEKTFLLRSMVPLKITEGRITI